jgi:hypothetical protein
MRKSKAIAFIRKRKRNGGLEYKQNQKEHPLLIAVEAGIAFMEATTILLKAITEADDPNAVCEQFEKEGLFKIHQETGDKLSTAIRECGNRMYGNYPVLPEPSPEPAENH